MNRIVALATIIIISACGGGGGGGTPPSAPTITLSAASLAFSGTAGGGNPASQQVAVTNSGAGSLAVPTATVAYTSGAGWLNVSVSGATAPFSVVVQPSIVGLAAGNYAATVSVASAGATNTPRTFAVTLSLGATPQPTMALSTASLSFSGKPTGAAPLSQTVTVSNAGPGTLAAPTASIAYGAGSGWLTATVSGSSAPYTVTVQPQASGLALGTYTATVSLAAAGASNSPASFSVSLLVDQTWTIFVYGHADHSLSQSLFADMAEMARATLNPSVNIIVAADVSAGRTQADGTPFESGTAWARIVGGASPIVDLGSLPEQNFDDPAVLQASIEAAFSNYPADRYGLVLWDHGGSWSLGFGGDENDVPGTSAGGMKVAQVVSAVRAALDATGLAGSRPLEFFAFDTCLMAGAEVTYEIRDLAKVYLAAAEIDFGDGWDYQATFTYLAGNRAATPRAFAEAEVAAWNAQHLAAGNDDKQLRSHIAIDLAQYDAYVTAFADLTTLLMSSTTLDPFEVARIQFSGVPGYWNKLTEPNSNPELRDAGQFLAGLSGLTSDVAIAGAAGTAANKLSAMTIAASNGLLRVGNGQAGFHMELPLASAWGAQKADYAALAWNTATGWSGVLDGLAAFGDAVAPSVATSITNASDPTTANPPTLLLASADSDVAEARVFLAEVLGGEVLMYGVVGTGTVLPNTNYQFVWRGKQAVLGDGVSQAYTTILPWIGGASPVYLARGVLSEPGVVGGPQTEAFAVLDSTSTAVTTVFLVEGGRLAALPVQALRGAQFNPTVWNVTTGGYVLAAPLVIPDTPAASLTLGFVQATPGDYLLLTSMTDVWGNTGGKADAVTVVNPF